MPALPIAVRIYGGLGNQMFQYAAGLAVASRLDTDLKVDLRDFDRGSQFKCGLGHFKLDLDRAGAAEMPPDRKTHRLAYLAWRAFGLKPKLFREDGLGYNPGIEALRPGSYLHGYWQSERYFKAIEPAIRDAFTLAEHPIAHNAAFADQIKAKKAVSLHVRRGDYANNPQTTAVHGLCSPEYYREAVEKIMASAGRDITLFVFSDEPDWAEANLDFPCEKVVVRGNNADTGHEDMRLMSLCQHHVIANSSFSWWGAWLNRSAEKLVCAPKRWFAAPDMHNPDIYPQGWHRI